MFFILKSQSFSGWKLSTFAQSCKRTQVSQPASISNSSHHKLCKLTHLAFLTKVQQSSLNCQIIQTVAVSRSISSLQCFPPSVHATEQNAMLRDKPPAALCRTEAQRIFHIKKQPLDTSKRKRQCYFVHLCN